MTTRWHRDSTTTLILASAVWSVVLVLVTLIWFLGAFGLIGLAFASVPAVLTILAALLIALTRRTGLAFFKICAAALAGVVALAVLTSFIIPAFAMLPACVLIFAAVAQEPSRSLTASVSRPV